MTRAEKVVRTLTVLGCLFLLGACSCRVKFMNPGWDLLMDVDWDEKLMVVQIARVEEGVVEEPEPAPVKKNKAQPETK
mgnify:CR=1 FL=1